MAISKGPQVFPRTEYLRRVNAVKADMAERGIDALVISDLRNITWLTGYTARTAYVPQGVVITCQNEEPTFILRKMDAPAAIHQSFLSRDSIISYPESLIGTPGKDGYDGVIDHVHKLGLANRSVGLEIGDLTVYTVEKFKARLPAATIVDCTKAVAWIRGVKSELEIAIMREAAAIADAGIMRAAEVIRAGVREADAMAEISATLARGANGKVGTDIAGNFFVPRHVRGLPIFVGARTTFVTDLRSTSSLVAYAMLTFQL